jgi:hypothetical protein
MALQVSSAPSSAPPSTPILANARGMGGFSSPYETSTPAPPAQLRKVSPPSVGVIFHQCNGLHLIIIYGRLAAHDHRM